MLRRTPASAAATPARAKASRNRKASALPRSSCTGHSRTGRTAFDRRRKFLHAELNKIPGITCLLAQGAFYLFPNISSFGLKDADFCTRLLEAEKVAAVPGSSFGAEGYLRLSYATSDEIIKKGVERLARFCATLKK